MPNIIICGRRKSGKSTYGIKLLKTHFQGIRKFIFDIQNDYGSIEAENDYIDTSGYREHFISIINENAFHSVVVFEEASAFFSNKGTGSNDMFKFLVSSSPSHRNNTTIFMFHSLRSIPKDILDYIDSIILFRTNDTASLIETKFRHDDKIKTAYYKVVGMPEYSKVEIVL